MTKMAPVGQDDSSANASSARLFIFVALAVLTAGSFALCLRRINARSLWLDEGASLAIASQHGTALAHALFRDGGNQAFYYLILHIQIRLFGSSLASVRLVSAIASAAVVPLVYGLGRQLFNSRVGIFAAALSSIFGPYVYWGQQARGYTLTAALATCSAWAFWLAVRRGRSLDIAMWCASSILLCYTNLLATLIVAAQFISLAAMRRHVTKPRAVTVGGVAISLALAPLLAFAAHRGTGQLFWLARPNRRVVEAAWRFLVGADSPFFGHWESAVLFVGVALLVAIAFAVNLIDRRRGRARVRDGAVSYLMLWLFLPPVTALLFSLAVRPVFLDHYFSGCIPAATLLVAWLLARIKPAMLGIAALVLVVGLRATQLPHTYREMRDNWSAATANVLRSAVASDCIAFDANDGWIDFNYYLTHGSNRAGAQRASWPRPILPNHTFGTDPVIIESYAVLAPSAIRALARQCPRVWLVFSHAGGSNPASATSRLIHRRFVEMRSELGREYPTRHVRRFTDITEYFFAAGERSVAIHSRSTSGPRRRTT